MKTKIIIFVISFILLLIINAIDKNIQSNNINELIKQNIKPIKAELKEKNEHILDLEYKVYLDDILTAKNILEENYGYADYEFKGVYDGKIKFSNINNTYTINIYTNTIFKNNN